MTMEMAQLRAELEQTRQDFLDLQNSSKEVERQLEEDLALAEKKASQYEELTKKLQDQIAQLRQSLSDSAIRVSSLQEDNQRLTEQLAQSMEERKKLEQQNDLLEQRERIAAMSAQRASEQVDQLLEKKALVEAELEAARARGREQEERLRQELQDLRADMTVAHSPKSRLTGLADVAIPPASTAATAVEPASSKEPVAPVSASPLSPDAPSPFFAGPPPTLPNASPPPPAPTTSQSETSAPAPAPVNAPSQGNITPTAIQMPSWWQNAPEHGSQPSAGSRASGDCSCGTALAGPSPMVPGFGGSKSSQPEQQQVPCCAPVPRPATVYVTPPARPTVLSDSPTAAAASAVIVPAGSSIPPPEATDKTAHSPGDAAPTALPSSAVPGVPAVFALTLASPGAGYSSSNNPSATAIAATVTTTVPSPPPGIVLLPSPPPAGALTPAELVHTARPHDDVLSTPPAHCVRMPTTGPGPSYAALSPPTPASCSMVSPPLAAAITVATAALPAAVSSPRSGAPATPGSGDTTSSTGSGSVSTTVTTVFTTSTSTPQVASLHPRETLVTPPPSLPAGPLSPTSPAAAAAVGGLPSEAAATTGTPEGPPATAPANPDLGVLPPACSPPDEKVLSDGRQQAEGFAGRGSLLAEADSARGVLLAGPAATGSSLFPPSPQVQPLLSGAVEAATVGSTPSESELAISTGQHAGSLVSPPPPSPPALEGTGTEGKAITQEEPPAVVFACAGGDGEGEDESHLASEASSAVVGTPRSSMQSSSLAPLPDAGPHSAGSEHEALSPPQLTVTRSAASSPGVFPATTTACASSAAGTSPALLVATATSTGVSTVTATSTLATGILSGAARMSSATTATCSASIGACADTVITAPVAFALALPSPLGVRMSPAQLSPDGSSLVGTVGFGIGGSDATSGDIGSAALPSLAAAMESAEATMSAVPEDIPPPPRPQPRLPCCDGRRHPPNRPPCLMIPTAPAPAGAGAGSCSTEPLSTPPEAPARCLLAAMHAAGGAGIAGGAGAVVCGSVVGTAGANPAMPGKEDRWAGSAGEADERTAMRVLIEALLNQMRGLEHRLAQCVAAAGARVPALTSTASASRPHASPAPCHHASEVATSTDPLLLGVVPCAYTAAATAAFVTASAPTPPPPGSGVAPAVGAPTDSLLSATPPSSNRVPTPPVVAVPAPVPSFAAGVTPPILSVATSAAASRATASGRALPAPAAVTLPLRHSPPPPPPPRTGLSLAAVSSELPYFAPPTPPPSSPGVTAASISGVATAPQTAYVPTTTITAAVTTAATTAAVPIAASPSPVVLPTAGTSDAPAPCPLPLLVPTPSTVLADTSHPSPPPLPPPPSPLPPLAALPLDPTASPAAASALLPPIHAAHTPPSPPAGETAEAAVSRKPLSSSATPPSSPDAADASSATIATAATVSIFASAAGASITTISEGTATLETSQVECPDGAAAAHPLISPQRTALPPQPPAATTDRQPEDPATASASTQVAISAPPEAEEARQPPHIPVEQPVTVLADLAPAALPARFEEVTAIAVVSAATAAPPSTVVPVADPLLEAASGAGPAATASAPTAPAATRANAISPRPATATALKLELDAAVSPAPVAAFSPSAILHPQPTESDVLASRAVALPAKREESAPAKGPGGGHRSRRGGRRRR